MNTFVFNFLYINEIHLFYCNSSSFISIPVWYSIVRIYHNLCIHSIIYRYLNCFQFGAVMNDADRSIHENIF